MASNRPWQGVRMRKVAAAADPEAKPRLVTLPSSWDDRAAEALAALAPGDGDVNIANVSALWLARLIRQAKCLGEDPAFAGTMQTLLRARKAAPNEPVWRGGVDAPGFVLNLAAFHEAGTFDIAGFARTANAVGRACRLLAPEATRYDNGLAGLDDLLAALGLAYDSAGARLAAACLACLFRARIDIALEGDQRDLLALPADWPAPPLRCPIPGLAEAAAGARAQVTRTACSKPSTGIFAPGPVEALLGIETGGLAPGFSPVRDRHLTRAAQNRLAAAALSPEAALAAVLEGDTPLPVPGMEAHAAMHEAVAPYLHRMPALPAALPAPSTIAKPVHRPRGPEPLPVRNSGLTQKIAIGGHRLFLRTSEYADGRLGEITLSMPRESTAFRATLEAFAQSVSIGLQHGVPLESFVDAFTLLSFSPAGAVEGDPAIGEASSVIDYVVRTLAKNYLGRTLAKPEFSEMRPDDETPLLPLNLPRGPSPRALRKTLRIVA